MHTLYISVSIYTVNEVVMRQCPRCKSIKIHKEKWREAIINDFKNCKVAGVSKTGNLMCDDCRFTSSPQCFTKKDP